MAVCSTPGTLDSRPATTSAICVEVAHPHDRDQVDVAGHRVHLADPVEIGDLRAMSGIRSGSTETMTIAVIIARS